MDLNHVQLTGRLDREPLLHDVGNQHVAALHLVSERSWRTRSTTVERSSYHYRLTAWESLADACGLYLHAGDYIYDAGRLRLFTSWFSGVEHTAHESVLDRRILLAPSTRTQPTIAPHALVARARARGLGRTYPSGGPACD